MPTPSLIAEYDRLYADARRIGEPVAAYEYKLVDADGAEVALPARLRARDGEWLQIVSFKPSRFHGNPGTVYTREGEGLVPSVFGLKIVVADNG